MFQNSYKLTDSGSKLFWVLASFKILIFEMDRCTPEMMTLPRFWYKNADPTRKWRQGSISFYSRCNHVLCHSLLCQFVTNQTFQLHNKSHKIRNRLFSILMRHASSMNILTRIMLELCTKIDEGQLNAETEFLFGLGNFLLNISLRFPSNTTIVHGDNETSIKLTKDFMQHRKVKHIHIMYH